jgi:hypothetical protein
MHRKCLRCDHPSLCLPGYCNCCAFYNTDLPVLPCLALLLLLFAP